MGKEAKSVHRAWEPWMPEEAREHLKAAREARLESLRSFLPPEFFEKQTEARREMLLAARSVIDRALEHLDSKSET